jgi:membrane protein YqaA with SNARE-associated domain
MPDWLLHLGIFGIFGVAFLDSAPFLLPIPGSTDLLILIFAAHHENAILLAAAAVLGSLFGGYVTWETGKRGGDPMLDRYVPRRIRSRVKRWTKAHGTLTVLMAALLPPPVPLLPFLLAAGALGVSRRQFLVALATARILRYGGEAALGATYGHEILRLWSRYLSSGLSTAILWTFLALLLSGIGFGVWRFRRQRHAERSAGKSPALKSAA